MKVFIQSYITRSISIAPLITLRVVFGALMLFAAVRFAAYGWINDLYIQPDFHFAFFGLDWLQPLPGMGMYLVFGAMALAATGIMLGAYYRIAAPTFLVLFSYVELIDKATYLNHYYLVTLIAFLLCLVPAHAARSIDAIRTPQIQRSTVPAWMIHIFMLQVGLVYFYAGIAKLTPHWLFEAMPLKIWLPARADMPLIGTFLDQEWTPYLFAWFGVIYDLTIVFFLLVSSTRKWAYTAVVVFHVLTWVLFQIGMFPWIMIGMTLVFFAAPAHERIQNLLGPWPKKEVKTERAMLPNYAVVGLLCAYFVIQVALPLRSHFSEGDLYWLEDGYRFSWRVMLMEKSGHITFRVVDSDSGKSAIVDHGKMLTQLQETQMCTQPDMILQMAQFIADDYATQGYQVEVYADAYVSLNGSGSKRFIDPYQNLLQLNEATNRNLWVYEY
jgi:hypothetical protein